MTPPHGFPPNVTFNLPTNHTGNPMQLHSSFTAAFSINLLLGLPTNSYVLWLIVTGAGSGVASDFFTLNLSVSEIIYCLSAMLVIIYIAFPGSILWQFMAFFTGFFTMGRPLFQCCICVERYLAVVHPVAFLKYRPLRYRVACSAVAWLLILGSCLVTMIMNLSQNYNYFMAQFLVIFSVKLFCCLAVLRALKQPGPGEGEGGREREGENHMKKRAFRIILIILVSMVVTYVPMVVATMLYSVHGDLLVGISFVIGVMTGLVHPLLYLHRAGKLPFIQYTLEKCYCVE